MQNETFVVNAEALVLYSRFPIEKVIFDTWVLGHRARLLRRQFRIREGYPTPAFFVPFFQWLAGSLTAYTHAEVNYAATSSTPKLSQTRALVTDYSDFITEACSFADLVQKVRDFRVP